MNDKSHVGMSRCFYCNEFDKVLLDRRLRQTLPRDCGVTDMIPCSKCEDWMKQGILFISVRDGEMEKVEASHKRARAEYQHLKTTRSSVWCRKNPFSSRWMPNPYRTGGWTVITEEAFQRMFNSSLVEQVLECRWTFVPDEVWDLVGLPRGDAQKEDL